MKGKLENLLKDKKKLIGIIVAVLLIVVIAIICVFAMSKKEDKNVLELKQEQFVVEYGDKISLNAGDYLKEDTNNNIITNTNVEILGDKKYEEGKEYYSIGNYQVQLTYENEKVQAQVTVKDTTLPTLNVPTIIEIPKNTDLSKYDFKSLITANDLAQLTDLKFDTSKVDMTKEGEYQATVSVEDSSKNKAEKTFTIKVVAELKENEKATTEVVKNVDGTTKVVVKKETANSNNEKDDNKSSNTSNSGSTNKPTSNNNSSSSNTSNSTSTTNKPSSGSSSSKPSGGTSSTDKPSSSGGSSSNKPSGGNTDKPSSGGSTSKPSDNDDKEEEKPHTHVFTVNTGKWFKTQAECEAYVDSVMEYWGNKLDNGEITYEEYGKKCPMGYEVYRCTCGMRGVNLSYAS